MHPRVAVAVRYVNLALRRQRSVRAAVERLPAHIRRRRAGDADLEQELAVGRGFAHEMAAVVGKVERIVGPHMDAMRPRVLAFAPGAQEIAVAVEYDDRVLAARERIDIVLAVDPDRGDLLERPAVRELRPILDDAILKVAGADDLCHLRSPSDFHRPTKRACAEIEPTLDRRCASFETAASQLPQDDEFTKCHQKLPHGEERPQGASRTTHCRDAVGLLRLFCETSHKNGTADQCTRSYFCSERM